MSQETKHLLFLLLLWASVGQRQVTAQSTPEQGSVRGIVTTDDGEPASGFTVDLIGTSTSSTWRKRAQTNGEGAFAFEHLKFGDYVIAPYLEGGQSRYPPGTLSFYNPKPVRVELRLGAPDEPLTIRLGAPNRIFSGTVVSASSGVPVLAAIQLEYQNDSDRFIRFSTSRDGLFRVLVPCKAQLVMRISAPGYSSQIQIVGPVAEDTDPQMAVRLTSLSGQ